MVILYGEASDCDPKRTSSVCQALQLAMLGVNLPSKQDELDKQAGSALYP